MNKEEKWKYQKKSGPLDLLKDLLFHTLLEWSNIHPELQKIVDSTDLITIMVKKSQDSFKLRLLQILGLVEAHYLIQVVG